MKSNQTISDAITALKKGEEVYRSSWNGEYKIFMNKGLAPMSEAHKDKTDGIDHLSGIAFIFGHKSIVLPRLCIQWKNGILGSYVFTDRDIFSNDWIIPEIPVDIALETTIDTIQNKA